MATASPQLAASLDPHARHHYIQFCHASHGKSHNKSTFAKEVSMESAMTRTLCKLLIVMMAWAPFQATQAGMIGTGEQIAVASAQTERSAVLSFINRADVARELQSRGVALASAEERIAALTDQEVRSLAGTLDTAPAGAGHGWVILILAGLIAWLVWQK